MINMLRLPKKEKLLPKILMKNLSMLPKRIYYARVVPNTPIKAISGIGKLVRIYMFPINPLTSIQKN